MRASLAITMILFAALHSAAAYESRFSAPNELVEAFTTERSRMAQV